VYYGRLGISSKAPENEKIKADMGDYYLHGLNSVGDIDYLAYSDIYDKSMELLEKMYELGKAEARSEDDQDDENEENM